jgi:hypothetical protein
LLQKWIGVGSWVLLGNFIDGLLDEVANATVGAICVKIFVWPETNTTELQTLPPLYFSGDSSPKQSCGQRWDKRKNHLKREGGNI